MHGSIIEPAIDFISFPVDGEQETYMHTYIRKRFSYHRVGEREKGENGKLILFKVQVQVQVHVNNKAVDWLISTS